MTSLSFIFPLPFPSYIYYLPPCPLTVSGLKPLVKAGAYAICGRQSGTGGEIFSSSASLFPVGITVNVTTPHSHIP
jgi:hypothetical protein